MSDVLTPVEVSYPGLERLLDGRYQVIQILATGGWGHTYLAQDTRRPSQPECVIQHIIPIGHEPAYQTALRHLFVREASTLERLGEHEQMPQLLACFENEQGFHLVQEFVSGTPLSLELVPQPWQEERVVQLLLECLEVLAVVHRDGCRHGDIRPDNLIRRSQDGTLILTNFGTVRDVHLSLITLQGQLASSMVPNTQGYQPPEQVQGLPCLASDIYAVGMIGIQALTGTPPLYLSRDALTAEILWQPFSQVAGSTLRHGLVAVLSRMVRADQTQRYPSAREALQALRQLAHAGLLNPVSQEPMDASMAAAIASPTPSQEPPQAFTLIAPDQAVPDQETPNQETPQETLVERLLSPAVQIGVGIGAVVAAAVCGYALPHLIDRTLFSDGDQDGQATANATPPKQAGHLQTSTLPRTVSSVESMPNASTVAAPTRDATPQATDRQTQVANTALQQGNWLTVLQQAQSLVQPATNQAETAADRLLSDAYNRAIVKDFAGAIGLLKQIPAGTTIDARVQEKLREYVEKQQVQAVSYLQTAYNQAEAKTFDKALETLQQISQGTPAYATAQTKIREYTEKQRIRADVLAMQDLNPGSYLQETNLAGR